MKFNSAAFSNVPVKGQGCLIAVYDEAVQGAVRKLDKVMSSSEHAQRICGFLVNRKLNGFAPHSTLLSVSYLDCLKEGYDTIKAKIVAQHGRVHIEAHAYSCPASIATDSYEQQISSAYHDPSLQSLILCSSGHDKFRVRFPATSKHAITVGFVSNDGEIVSAGLGGLLPPSFLVHDYAFPALDNEGNLIYIKGTSPAVTFVAGLAALISEKLHHPTDSEQLHAGLLLLSIPYKQTLSA